MKNRIGMQPNTWPQRCTLVAGVLCAALLASAHTQAKADVPFVVDAIAKAKEAPTAEGRWAVIANVVFSTSEKSERMTATGEVNFVATPAEGLKGVIPMTIGDDAETSKINALGLAIQPDGTVGIQWRIADKPFLGRRPFVFKPNAFPDYFSKGINFGGAFRRMKLTLSSTWIKAERPKIRVPGEDTKPRIRVPGEDTKPKIRVPGKKEPIGKRYKITARVVVTNSDDGIADDTVEVQGALYLSYGDGSSTKAGTSLGEVGKFIDQPLEAGDSVPLGSRMIDHIFDKPETFSYVLEASFSDYDSIIIKHDGMINRKTARRSLDAHAKSGKERRMAGDGDSESLDIYYTVKEVKDLYEGDVK